MFCAKRDQNLINFSFKPNFRILLIIDPRFEQKQFRILLSFTCTLDSFHHQNKGKISFRYFLRSSSLKKIVFFRKRDQIRKSGTVKQIVRLTTPRIYAAFRKKIIFSERIVLA